MKMASRLIDLISKIIIYIDLARAKSEALVNNT